MKSTIVASPCAAISVDAPNVWRCFIIQIREITGKDLNWVVEVLRNRWGSERIVTRGKVYNASELPSKLVCVGDRRVGHAAYRIEDDTMEIVSLTTTLDNVGIGTALLEDLERLARGQGIRRIWLVTTNDNLNALAFWQKRGYRISGVYPGAIEKSRELKPEIPEVAENGIPIRDEIELEKNLAP
ncbi:MAG: GNAT family N-acetyltransferase [Candidatus Thorarchaeota archaeon]|nr:GNAT family N-acetyltransferase [Candidatus Thorarchaeota archaeon]